MTQFTRESLDAMTSDQILKLWDSYFVGACPGRQEAIEMLLGLQASICFECLRDHLYCTCD